MRGLLLDNLSALGFACGLACNHHGLVLELKLTWNGLLLLDIDCLILRFACRNLLNKRTAFSSTGRSRSFRCFLRLFNRYTVFLWALIGLCWLDVVNSVGLVERWLLRLQSSNLWSLIELLGLTWTIIVACFHLTQVYDHLTLYVCLLGLIQRWLLARVNLLLLL